MGTLWSKSGDVQLDNSGDPAGGCEAEFFVGGTTTPLAVYQDRAETTPHEDPVEADANGRWPAVFIPFSDAGYGVRVTTSGGTQLYYFTTIANADPVEASEDSVDDNQLLQTGDWLFSTKTGTRTGFVRANARTIGSASSGATERANADTEDLYTFLWDNHADGICAVTGGRGASASADFDANKPIALPDARSAGPMGVDDMGNSALSAGYGGSFTTGNATTGGSVGGANTHTLSTAESAAHTHVVTGTSDSAGSHTHTATVTDPGHTHTISQGTTAGSGGASVGAGGTSVPNGAIQIVIASSSTGVTVSNSTAANHQHTFTVTSNSTGGGGAHNNMQRHVLGNWLIKL